MRDDELNQLLFNYALDGEQNPELAGSEIRRREDGRRSRRLIAVGATAVALIAFGIFLLNPLYTSPDPTHPLPGVAPASCSAVRDPWRDALLHTTQLPPGLEDADITPVAPDEIQLAVITPESTHRWSTSSWPPTDLKDLGQDEPNQFTVETLPTGERLIGAMSQDKLSMTFTLEAEGKDPVLVATRPKDSADLVIAGARIVDNRLRFLRVSYPSDVSTHATEWPVGTVESWTVDTTGGSAPVVRTLGDVRYARSASFTTPTQLVVLDNTNHWRSYDLATHEPAAPPPGLDDLVQATITDRDDRGLLYQRAGAIDLSFYDFAQGRSGQILPASYDQATMDDGLVLANTAQGLMLVELSTGVRAQVLPRDEVTPGLQARIHAGWLTVNAPGPEGGAGRRNVVRLTDLPRPVPGC